MSPCAVGANMRVAAFGAIDVGPIVLVHDAVVRLRALSCR